MTVNRQVLLAAHPVGMMDESNFELVEGPVPEPGDGEALLRTRYLSLDPAIRGWMNARDQSRRRDARRRDRRGRRVS
jgi:hypothetical protein